MSGEQEPLSKLAESVADGESVDWDALSALAADDDERRLLAYLRIIANVADVQRSQIDDVAPPTVDGEPAFAPDGQAAGAGPAPSPGHDLGVDFPTRENLGRWGHLLLIRKIGEGAFGEVYEAHDTWLDHPRALKLLKPNLGSRVSPSQVLHEARKLVRVRHPNVVTVHGADGHDGRVGFWMDLIEGQTLAERVGEGRLSCGEATDIGQELCRALAAVHHAKLLHRDVKAQNVMRAADGGRIILMDFGAGEFMDAPVTGRRHGTPLYLAPELFQSAPATTQTDIYALGVLLYYLVTGRFPVDGKSMADLEDAHKRGRRVHLRDARPDLPDFFVSVVERAIDPDPTRRFESAGHMQTALAGRLPPAPPIPTPVEAPGTLQYVGVGILAVMCLLAAIEVLGFVASRIFEVSLQIHPDFAAGPADYLKVGREALLPFVIYWVGCAVIVGILPGIQLLFRARLEAWWNPLISHLDALDQTALATIVFVSGTACWAILSWAYWDTFSALSALRNSPVPAEADLAILGPDSWSHFLHSSLSACVSFVLVFAAWRWFPRLEQRGVDRTAIRRLRWATVAVALVIIATAMTTRRVIWERFEVVLFEKRPAVVIGTSADELLLFAARASGSARQRVRQDAPALERKGGTTRRLFDPRNTQPIDREER